MSRHDACEGTPYMSVVAELLLVTSSVGLSLALSRLALGEVFRLVRLQRPAQPENTDRR